MKNTSVLAEHDSITVSIESRDNGIPSLTLTMTLHLEIEHERDESFPSLVTNQVRHNKMVLMTNTQVCI